MRFGLPQHLIVFVIANAGFAVLNLAPVGFDLSRPDVPLWFLYPLACWGLVLVVHALLVVLRRGRPPPAASAEPETPRVIRAERVDPRLAGKAGTLLVGCRQQAGQTLTTVGATGSVPLDLDDLLRGAVDQAERLAEHLAPLYLARKRGKPEAQAQVERLEGLLEELERALKALRFEAQVLSEGDDPMSALEHPVEALREAILCAAEALAG